MPARQLVSYTKSKKVFKFQIKSSANASPKPNTPVQLKVVLLAIYFRFSKLDYCYYSIIFCQFTFMWSYKVTKSPKTFSHLLCTYQWIFLLNHASIHTTSRQKITQIEKYFVCIIKIHSWPDKHKKISKWKSKRPNFPRDFCVHIYLYLSQNFSFKWIKITTRFSYLEQEIAHVHVLTHATGQLRAKLKKTKNYKSKF